MEMFLQPEILIALLTLVILEIVLGIDNLVFISILASKLPEAEQKKARNIGLFLAMFMRVGLLFCISWVMQLTNEIFTLSILPYAGGDLPNPNEISGRDLILIVGGLFLLFKSTKEIHEHVEGDHGKKKTKGGTFFNVILQIVILDLIFSLDSVITAVGLVDQIEIMVIAVVIAIIFMLIFVGSISDFIEKHPTVKVLALSFLLLIGMALIGDGLELHIPKGYIYFAMGFSIFIEIINMKSTKGKIVK